MISGTGGSPRPAQARSSCPAPTPTPARPPSTPAWSTSRTRPALGTTAAGTTINAATLQIQGDFASPANRSLRQHRRRPRKRAGHQHLDRHRRPSTPAATMQTRRQRAHGSGVISGTGTGLTKAGAGTLALPSGRRTPTPARPINSGIVNIANSRSARHGNRQHDRQRRHPSGQRDNGRTARAR